MQSFDIDYLVIGGGVAGIAIAAKLSSIGKEVILVEKNNLLAQETSSRNSEVIHSGIYYEEGSLKIYSLKCIRDLRLGLLIHILCHFHRYYLTFPLHHLK